MANGICIASRKAVSASQARASNRQSDDRIDPALQFLKGLGATAAREERCRAPGRSGIRNPVLRGSAVGCVTEGIHRDIVFTGS